MATRTGHKNVSCNAVTLVWGSLRLAPIIVPSMQLSDVFSICSSICCVALPSSNQQRSLTLEASVAGKRSAKLLDDDAMDLIVLYNFIGRPTFQMKKVSVTPWARDYPCSTVAM